MVAGPALGRRRAGRPARTPDGFTLAEALVALTISSVLVVLVSSVFLAQNRYYAIQMERSGAQDVIRALTELVGAEVRSTAAGGIRTARRDSLTVRSPIVIGAVCATQGLMTYVQMDEGGGAMDSAELAGVAVYDTVTSAWSFYNRAWSVLDGGAADAADRCAANGADTVGAHGDFHGIRRLLNIHGSIPPLGTPIMLFRETTFAFRTSELDTATLALYRGAWRDAPVEYATGLDTSASFQYRRVDQSGYSDAVVGQYRDSIDAVRLVAEARRRPQAGGTEDVTFGWSVTIPVRNVR